MNKYRKYTKKHLDSKRAWAVELLGGACKSCGATKNLEFDHIEPSTVEFRIGANLGTTKARLLDELNKCQLLCSGCHLTKTIEDRGWKRSEHGRSSMYTNYRCRCSKCKQAWAEYKREYRRRVFI